MPSKTFRRSAVAEAGVGETWKALNHPASWEAVAGVDRITESVLDQEGSLQGFSFESVAAGKRYVGKATPAGREPEKMMAWNIDTSEVRGRIIVTLDGDAQRTRVDVTLHMESVGVLSTVFFPVISAAIDDGFPTSVEKFAAHLSRP